MTSPCHCCGNNDFSALPVLPQTVISDGRIWSRPLKKHCCKNCGASAHVKPLNAQDIQEIYSAPYSLGSHHTAADIKRTENYKDWILDVLKPLSIKKPRKILEVGCGNGLLAKSFQDYWASADLYGIEPAAQAVNHAKSLGVEVFQGILEDIDLSDLYHKIDLIYSVNVIEHSLNPVAYLKEQKKLLTDDGVIVAVCPNATTPNIETLFFDHITSFTQKSLLEAAQQADLVLIHTQIAPAFIGDFQIAIFQKQGVEIVVNNNIPDIISAQKDYYLQWQNLDKSLCAKITDKDLIIFGAGEMSSIIRGLAPNFWTKATYVTLDTPSDKNFHEKEIIALDKIPPKMSTIFVAVRPDFGQLVEDKLEKQGFETISIHHYISH